MLPKPEKLCLSSVDRSMGRLSVPESDCFIQETLLETGCLSGFENLHIVL